MTASPSRTDLLAAVGAGGATVVVLGLVRAGLGLWGALGTDAALWGLTARDLWVGARPLVPPLYPGLLAPWTAAGASPADVGGWVSLLSGGLVFALAMWALRRLGLMWHSAVTAGLLCFALPDVAGWAFQLQPDALAAAWGLALGLGLALHLKGHRRAVIAVVCLGGLAPLLRAHGLVWAATAMLGLLAGPGRTRWTALLVPLLMWMAPVFLGVQPGIHPIDFPWSDRAGGALSALTTTDPESLSYLRELHRGEWAKYARLVTEGRRVAQVTWHVKRSLMLAPDGWLIVGGGLLASTVHAWRSRSLSPLALALPLLAALPALIIWSQRRHVVLMVPLALVCIVAATGDRKRVIALLSFVLAIHGGINWPRAAAAWQTERPRAEHYAEVGDWLHKHAPENSLLGAVFQDIGLYAPAMGRHDPDGTQADWWTFYVGDRPPRPGALGAWTVVHQGPGGMSVYQLEPTRSPRPCAHHPPAENTPHLAISTAHADVPGCMSPDR